MVPAGGTSYYGATFGPSCLNRDRGLDAILALLGSTLPLNMGSRGY